MDVSVSTIACNSGLRSLGMFGWIFFSEFLQNHFRVVVELELFVGNKDDRSIVFIPFVVDVAVVGRALLAVFCELVEAVPDTEALGVVYFDDFRCLS